MINIRKILAVFLAAAVVSAVPFNVVKAQPKVIYEARSTQKITSGATVENIKRLTAEGWLNINVLRINLADPYIKVDTLTNGQQLGKLASTLTMARNSGAVAAVNAGFFTPTGSGMAIPDGFTIQAGNALTASSSYNKYSDAMASFSIDNLNQLLYYYWKTNITLKAPNGNSLPVAVYNKIPGSFQTSIAVLDRKWSSTTPGATAVNPDLVEMLVDAGKVMEIRQGQPAAAIPETGYVVITSGANAAALTNNFAVGDNVEMSIATNPDWKNLNTLVTGASILVKDGAVPKVFSFSTDYINKRNPRTVVGSSKDGKQLLLVTVDGRQLGSIGMTQTETAQFMLELGAYNALNMDGGGSTAMVARLPGDTATSVINSPSDGVVRGVTTGLGIFSIAPPGPLATIMIQAEDTNIFVNTSREFTVKGFDSYFNPVEIKPGEVKWSVSGVKGTFDGNILRPSTVGEGKVTASVGDIKSVVPISSLSSPVKLALSVSVLKVPVGQSRNISVVGYNKNGYSGIINPSDLNWKVSSDAGECVDGTFTGMLRGTGYVDASVGSVHSYCPFSVSADVTTVKDTFESSSAAFISYPETVKGSFEISPEQVHSGNSSGKLTYDFTDTEGTRAAYMVYQDKGLPLTSDVSKISVWVYNDHENSNWVRGEVADSTGKKHNIDFTLGMQWTGWKQLEASLDGITSPAYLSWLYVVQVNPVADSGSVYLDDMSLTISGYPDINTSNVPKNTVPADSANKTTTYIKGTNNFRFSVFGSTQEPRNPLEKLLTSKMKDKINKYLDFAVYTGKNAVNASKGVKKPTVAITSGYKSVDYKNSRFIRLDMSKGGLRSVKPEQWTWLFSQLDTFKGSNVFITLSGSPGTFSDYLEAKLFKDTLAEYRKKTNKNIWVFYMGSSNAGELDRGVRYISCSGLNAPGITAKDTSAAKYILVTVTGNTVTYEIRPIV